MRIFHRPLGRQVGSTMDKISSANRAGSQAIPRHPWSGSPQVRTPGHVVTFAVEPE